MDRMSTNPNYRHTKRASVILASTALSAALLTSCTAESYAPQHSTETVTPRRDTATAESSPTANETLATNEPCGLWDVKVGEYFNPDQAERIDDQLDLLEDLRDGDELKLGDIRTASSIIRFAQADPMYADGIITAKQSILAGNNLNSDEFLELPISEPAMCEPERTDAETMGIHLANLKEIGGYVTSELSSQFGTQSGRRVEKTIDDFNQEFEEFIEEAENYLEQH